MAERWTWSRVLLSGGVIVTLFGVTVGLTQYAVGSIEKSIDKLSGKVDALQAELEEDRTAVAVLNSSGTDIANDIRGTRTTVEANGNKLDAISSDVSYLKGEVSIILEQMKAQPGAQPK